MKPKQIALPSAPVIDWTGLHARECECSRCQLGYGPTDAEREAAKREKQKEHLAKAVTAAAVGRLVTKEAKAIRAKERQVLREMQVAEALEEEERSKQAASLPPEGGFREFMKGGGR